MGRLSSLLNYIINTAFNDGVSHYRLEVFLCMLQIQPTLKYKCYIYELYAHDRAAIGEQFFWFFDWQN